MTLLQLSKVGDVKNSDCTLPLTIRRFDDCAIELDLRAGVGGVGGDLALASADSRLSLVVAEAVEAEAAAAAKLWRRAGFILCMALM